MPLREIYPEFQAPMSAKWLTGTFFAKFGFCVDTEGGFGEFQIVEELTVVSGTVVRIEKHPPIKYDRPRYLCGKVDQ